MLRALLTGAAVLLLTACARGQPAAANYQFNAPVAAVTARIAALAAVGSALSRIEVRRPPLRADSSSAGAAGLVKITVPGGANQRGVVLTFTVTRLYDDTKSMVALTVVAFALDAAALVSLQATLEKRFGKKLNLTVELQPELIGGVRVVVGDEVLDTSVKARLEQMKAALIS